MKVSDAFPSKYIAAADLQGKTPTVTIANVVMEQVGKPGEPQKPVVYFQGKQKGMVLNKTNAHAIAAAYGDDMEEWIGAAVELFVIWTDFQGKAVEAIRVRIPQRRAAPAGNGKPFPGDTPNKMHDDEIGF